MCGYASQGKIDMVDGITAITTVKMSYVTNPIVTNALVTALAPIVTEPKPDIIRAPPHYHRFWSATRARKFAQVLLKNPKHRGNYDQNIRLIAQQTHPTVDVRQFIQKVNPVLWCLKVNWSKYLVQRLIQPRDLGGLWQSCAYSSCAHCRELAHKHSGYMYFRMETTSANPTQTCE